MWNGPIRRSLKSGSHMEVIQESSPGILSLLMIAPVTSINRRFGVYSAIFYFFLVFYSFLNFQFEFYIFRFESLFRFGEDLMVLREVRRNYLLGRSLPSIITEVC